MIAIEKLVLIIIFLIVIIIVVLFLFSGKTSADTLWLQSDLRTCCQKYRALGGTGSCMSRTQVEGYALKCNGKFFLDIVDELKMDVEDDSLSQTKIFCGCSK